MADDAALRAIARSEGIAAFGSLQLLAALSLSCDVRVPTTGTIPRVEIAKAVRIVTWQLGATPLPGL